MKYFKVLPIHLIFCFTVLFSEVHFAVVNLTIYGLFKNSVSTLAYAAFNGRNFSFVWLTPSAVPQHRSPVRLPTYCFRIGKII
jgi:hypothetical protein